jgi:lysophospholipase L1-like esterase
VNGNAEKGESERLSPDVRWTGRLASLLGGEYHIIEDGLNGRTTAFNDILGKYRNGAKYLGVCLTSQKPVDLLIFILGSNDIKRHLGQSPSSIGKGMEKLIRIARSDGFGPGGNNPEILIITPARLREEILESFVRQEFDHSSVRKSQELAKVYYDIARKQDCFYMNASVYAEASTDDGLHLDANNHKKLAEAVAVKVREIFEADEFDEKYK